MFAPPPRVRVPISLMLPLMISRDEVAAWVLGVSGSVFRKAKSWEEARETYNTRLAAGAVQILA